MELTQEQRERYARHFVLSDIGEEGQKRLLAAKVLVLGAGALGSAALMYLASAGIGTIGIVDGDNVELSNLHRQVIHKNENVGKPKAVSAAERIHEINPDVHVEIYHRFATTEDICELIEPYDFIVDAVDTFATKLLVSDACVLMKKPFVHAGIVRFGGQAMTYVPGQGPCLRCILGHAPDPSTVETAATVGVLGAVTGILGCVEATEAVKYIIGKGKLLTGRMFFFDGLEMNTRVVDLGEAYPHCIICSPEASVTDLKQLEDEYRRS